jgi:uncharacterized protein (DUF488 family)
MIFSIGTSNRSLVEFLGELRRRNITQLIDVRSSPYSRVPHFNAGQIIKWAGAAGILYRQAGQILGGMSDVPTDDPEYHAAIDRLVQHATREQIAIFCAEGDPAKCHRSYTVGAALLLRHDVAVQNICRDGTTETIRKTLSRTPDKLLDPAFRELRPPVQTTAQRGLFEQQ